MLVPNSQFNEPFPDFCLNDTTTKSFIGVIILGILIENEADFKSHLKNICKNANQNVVTDVSVKFAQGISPM